jgi:hypothetical protein
VTQECTLLCHFTALHSALLCFSLLRHYALFHFTCTIRICFQAARSSVLLAHLPAEKLPAASTMACCWAGVPAAAASASTGAAVTLGSS